MVISVTPDELAGYRNFLVWRLVKSGGTTKKIPFNPTTGQRASTVNPEDWSSLEEAQFVSDSYSGIGFVFSGRDPFIGIDIDHCVDESTLEITPWARRIVDKLNSYTEYSPSKTGLHIFLQGENFSGPNQVNCIPGAKVEMYCRERYFTLTGDHVTGTPQQVMDRTDEFMTTYQELIDDAKAVDNGKRLENGPKFAKLWAGDWSDDYQSQSEADLALVSWLVAMADGDTERADRLFRYSALWREKWDEQRGQQTYGERTLEQALKSYNTRKALSSNLSTMDPHYTEMGNAQRLVMTHGENITYCATANSWFIWDKTRWARDSTLTILRLIKQILVDLNREALTEPDRTRRQDMIEHVLRSESYQRVKGAELLARSLVPVTQDQFDRQPMLLNVLNGTLDLENGDLMPHERTDLITKLASVEFDPDAKCPLWEKFLLSILNGDTELMTFLQKAVGYTMTGSTREQVMFFLYGLGANGKTTFLETIREMLGDYAAQADSSTFMAKREEGPRNDIARLVGRRFVVSTEVEENRRMGEVVIKQLTGSDAVTARFLHQEFFEFKPAFKIWIAGNHKPQIGGSDEGIWRRIRLIPFTVTVPENARDHDLGRKLKTEMPGILNWALEGIKLWQAQGLRAPTVVTDATREYRGEMDIISTFMDACCELNKDKSRKMADMYKAYETWCVDTNEKMMTKRAFEMKLRERGLESKARTNNVRWWVGVTLTLEGETAAVVAEASKNLNTGFESLFEN